MNELLAITVNTDDRQTVSGRDLHNFLEVSTRYNDWFTQMLSYGFSETIDFVTITQKRVTAQGKETTFTDHMLTIDMAKGRRFIYNLIHEKYGLTPRFGVKEHA